MVKVMVFDLEVVIDEIVAFDTEGELDLDRKN